jgi:prepilin-type N-terminal cleavage/methylation domain-containing protein
MNGSPCAKGFSLFEILIALSIVSILAVVAVPMYLNYDVRARITEGFALVDPVKIMVADYYQTTGTWPNSNQTAGVQAPEGYKTDNVASIKVDKDDTDGNSLITITYRIPALGSNNTIILTSENVSGRWIQWSCNHGTVINKFRPAACKL